MFTMACAPAVIAASAAKEHDAKSAASSPVSCSPERLLVFEFAVDSGSNFIEVHSRVLETSEECRHLAV